jgi:hypothetical protein
MSTKIDQNYEFDKLFSTKLRDEWLKDVRLNCEEIYMGDFLVLRVGRSDSMLSLQET